MTGVGRSGEYSNRSALGCEDVERAERALKGLHDRFIRLKGLDIGLLRSPSLRHPMTRLLGTWRIFLDKDQKPQPDKFRELARELECHEDEAAFEEKVRKVATTPKPEAEPQE